MKLGKQILNILSKTYAASTMVETSFGRYDLAFRTDEAGRPVLLFIGIKNENGRITGERFSRKIVIDKEGKVIKDHWDNKGKSGGRDL
jgi:hypothetical protein